MTAIADFITAADALATAGSVVSASQQVRVYGGTPIETATGTIDCGIARTKLADFPEAVREVLEQSPARLGKPVRENADTRDSRIVLMRSGASIFVIAKVLVP